MFQCAVIRHVYHTVVSNPEGEGSSKNWRNIQEGCILGFYSFVFNTIQLRVYNLIFSNGFVSQLVCKLPENVITGACELILAGASTR